MLDIGEVSRRTGHPPSTLRYYEQKGLIQSNGRNGLRRTFSDSVLDRLALISLGRAAGFSLAEIGEVFGGTRGIRINRKKLLAKAAEIDAHIQRLIKIRDGLRTTAACPEKRHMTCPNFRRTLESAASGDFPPLNATDL
ncbi:MAG: helix-turn-helix domain-containing protein [Pseudomonadota bacterium]